MCIWCLLYQHSTVKYKTDTIVIFVLARQVTYLNTVALAVCRVCGVTVGVGGWEGSGDAGLYVVLTFTCKDQL